MLADPLDYHSNMPKIGVFGEAMNRTAEYRPGHDLRVVMRNLAAVTNYKKPSIEAEICRSWATNEPLTNEQKVSPSEVLTCPCMESEIGDLKAGIENSGGDEGDIYAKGGGN